MDLDAALCLIERDPGGVGDDELLVMAEASARVRSYAAARECRIASEIEKRRLAEKTGAGGVAGVLSGASGESRRKSGQRRRMAKELEALPATFEGLESGRISEEHVRAITEAHRDPKLREAVEAQSLQPMPDLWPFVDAMAGLPLCLIRGTGSNLLTRATADEMARRRPDMTRAEVPGRGHVPFLDEPEALAALNQWCKALK